MDEEHKRQIAVWRFGVIGDFVTPIRLDYGERERLLRDKCAREWQIPFSDRTRLARTTILSWIQAYLAGNRRLEALMPRDRSDRGTSRVLDEDTAQALVRLRAEMPKATVRRLITEAHQRRLVNPEVILSAATVWRFLNRRNLARPPAPAPEDRRKFEAELPNEVWQSDAMHGPLIIVEGKRRKVYLFAFIDDMSRLILHAQFYPSEQLEVYLDALRQALLTRGLPRKLYVDNGAAFRSLHLKEIAASLGIALVHSPPYQPQGRGKVERWFRTVRTEFLPGFRGQSLAELNEALDLWIREVYHRRPHRGTGEEPLRRFASNTECLRPAPRDLEDHFRKSARRRVAKDRTVALNGRIYEAPVELVGAHVMLLYHPHDPARVECRREGRTHGMLRPVDVHVNCRVRRRQETVRLEVEPRPISGGKLPFAGRQEDPA
jgi:transposase InsO family protein